MNQTQQGLISTNGQVLEFPNLVAADTVAAVVYTMTGAPMATAMVIQLIGVSAGGGHTLLDYYAGLAPVSRTVNLDGVTYSSFLVVATWTGGVNVNVNVTLSVSGAGFPYSNVSGNVGATPVIVVAEQTQTLTAAYQFVEAVGGSSGITLTLPQALMGAGPVIIVKTDAGAGAVSVVPQSGEAVNGSSVGYALVNQWQSVEVMSDGSNWTVTSNN